MGDCQCIRCGGKNGVERIIARGVGGLHAERVPVNCGSCYRIATGGDSSRDVIRDECGDKVLNQIRRHSACNTRGSEGVTRSCWRDGVRTLF